MGDGHLGKCKDCTKKDSEIRRSKKEQDPSWVEAELARHRQKSALYRSKGLVNAATKAKKSTYVKTYRSKFPEKVEAVNLVAQAIKKKIIVRQPCFCGAKAHAHHEDYSKPLDVVWLCPMHHNERHVQIRLIQRAAKSIST
jgi:hypothetical protein